MKIRTIILILIPALLAIGLTGGLVLVTRLALLLALVLLTGYLWMLFSIRGIEAKVGKVAHHCHAGEQFEKEVTILNRSRLPKLLLRISENSDMPGYNNMTALNLSPGGSYLWETSVHCRQRGQYHLGAITATVTDPFGLFSRQRHLGESHHVLIYPAMLELPYFESTPLNVFGYNTGYRSFSQISPSASSVREYTTGDSLNHIHWHSTAHTAKLMVKTFDTDRSHSGFQNTWILIDMQRSPHAGEGEESTEEYAVTIAASLVKKYIDSGLQVGLAASGDQSYLFPPRRGEQHLWHIMEALALMKATGQISISQLIGDKMESFRDRATVIVITPSNNRQVVTSIRQLKKLGNLAAAVWLEPSSFGGKAGPINIARSLSASGVQVYTVSKGDDLTRALDSRITSPYQRYI